MIQLRVRHCRAISAVRGLSNIHNDVDICKEIRRTIESCRIYHSLIESFLSLSRTRFLISSIKVNKKDIYTRDIYTKPGDFDYVVIT